MSCVSHNSSVVQINDYGCLLEFGEKKGCWGGDWGLLGTVIRKWMFRDKALKHLHFYILMFFFPNEGKCIYCCWSCYHCHWFVFHHADSTNNKQGKQGKAFQCWWCMSALSKCCSCCQMPWLPSPFSLAGLRGLTSVIAWRMEAHYKISALCLSIRVTERGLVAAPCHSELCSTLTDRSSIWGFSRWTK